MTRFALLLRPMAMVVLLGGLVPIAIGGDGLGQPPPDKGSVTVFPIVFRPALPVMKTEDGTEIDFGQRVAMVLGEFLERAGVEDVELAEAKFNAAEDQDVKKTAAALSKFVRENPIKTDYAFYSEIHGTPQTGPTEIRTIVVDKQGKVILADRDDSKTYAQTGKVTPKDPMTCCVFIAHKAQKLWNLADPLREDAPSGKMAARMRKQSGLPPEEEFAAIAKRRAAIPEKATFAVYPVKIGDETDKDCAAQLVDALNQQKICQAVAADAEAKLTVGNDPNEMRVLWDTARAFREFLRKNPPKTDYAVLADYGIGRTPSGKTNVRYVHIIVCDKAGDWVFVDLQNSHHADFQAVDPKSREDCNRLVIRRAKAATEK